ncbi:MAG: hypothetical protein WCH85_10970 [Methanomicrobiales archaeon]
MYAETRITSHTDSPVLRAVNDPSWDCPGPVPHNEDWIPILIILASEPGSMYVGYVAEKVLTQSPVAKPGFSLTVLIVHLLYPVPVVDLSHFNASIPPGPDTNCICPAIAVSSAAVGI